MGGMMDDCLKAELEGKRENKTKTGRSKKISVRKARGVIKEALDSDEGLKISYVSNIAMLLHDRYGITNCEKRTQAAEDILSLLFN